MKENIPDILKFIQLTHKLQQVRRTIHVKDEDRKENDLEHSYQLAMLAWYILSKNTFNLDKDLVIKYALTHDLVEAYAGDTFIFDKESIETKHIREQEAQKKLQEEFSDFEDMNILIQNYEDRKDDESKFVYALDKIIPMLNIYLDNGRTWKKNKITLEMLVEAKKNKVSLSPECNKYFEELVDILSKQPDLFNPNIL